MSDNELAMATAAELDRAQALIQRIEKLLDGEPLEAVLNALLSIYIVSAECHLSHTQLAGRIFDKASKHLLAYAVHMPSGTTSIH